MCKHCKQNDASAAGCVLAGGKSSRMGTDKAMLELDGEMLVNIAVGRFAGFDEVFISASDAEAYAFTGTRTVADDPAGIGPLGGIISALNAAESELVCFRPVDVPLVPAGLHQILADACRGKDAAVPFVSPLCYPEPLLACYSKTALPVLENLAETGDFRVADAFRYLDVSYIRLDSPDMVSLLGDPRRYLVNANDPEAFSCMKALFDAGADY